MEETAFGIYVHIPYCRSKCLYCDFYSELCIPDSRLYIKALLREFAARKDLIDSLSDSYTLYIGGGTPSLIDGRELIELSQGIIGTIGFAPEEFTIEVNPEDVTPSNISFWRDAGADRISMGVESLIDNELKRIGRRHDAAKAIKAYSLLRDKFNNISLDIMFGLPGQTLESLGRSLQGIADMHPEHVSAYSLMYEEGTAMTRLREMGRITDTPEEISIEMFSRISDTLAEVGYEQYEISNYSRAGFRSHHNSLYWTGHPYLGLGAGAHSYDGKNRRAANIPDATNYIKKWSAEELPDTDSITILENLGETELREEMIMTRLRMREGLDLKEFGRRFGYNALTLLISRANPYIASGSLHVTSGHLALTRSGIMLSDSIIASLF